MPTLLQLKKGYFHSSERNENMYSEHFLPSDYYSSLKASKHSVSSVFEEASKGKRVSSKRLTFSPDERKIGRK